MPSMMPSDTQASSWGGRGELTPGEGGFRRTGFLFLTTCRSCLFPSLGAVPCGAWGPPFLSDMNRPAPPPVNLLII
ncbi:hypothetical protein JZ751_019194 [Albula glossodonta]|uniref:Uncharacterized protein n=1 Tax=Albula glossodonta TaxID=121402 RepID=A0A8T2NYB1_9TELE|nr:hypothetical protein JZ751_019194 [Albula glossodonta]